MDIIQRIHIIRTNKILLSQNFGTIVLKDITTEFDI
jgi:hypothetical protein